MNTVENTPDTIPETYFNKLNYTLSNEDPSLELKLMPTGCSHAVAIAGSGARVLPLLAKNPKIISCVDASPAQLALTQLRIETLRELGYPEFLAFWGYPGKGMSPQERKQIFDQCKLSDSYRGILRHFFEDSNWESLLYTGGWERTILGFSRIFNFAMGRSLDKLFQCQTLEETHRFLDTTFPSLRWKLVLSILANGNTFNALLYKGRFPKRNTPESYFQTYANGFARLFRMTPARENYILQLVLLGGIKYPEGLPTEADATLFEAMKAGLKDTEIRYLEGNILECFNTPDNPPIDFLSFSDVPSYFAGESQQSFLQRLRPALAENARLAIRYFFHIPENLDTSGFENVTALHQELISSDRTPFYRTEIWEKRS